jgi:glycosyltransferase involved in cell wall biosynthesis
VRVLIQNSIFHPNVIGGAEISSYLLAEQLAARGWQVDALATSGRRDGAPGLVDRPLGDTGGRVYEAPSGGLYDLYRDGGPAPAPGLLIRGLHHFAAVHSPRWGRLAGEVLDRLRPDLLHTNTIVGMTPAVWQAARARGIPVVHTLRDYHLLCARTTLLRSSGAECTTMPLPCAVLKRLKLARTGGLQVVTAPSRFVLQRHLDAGGFPGARAEVVPNACEEIPIDPPTRTAADPPRGLYLGHLDAHKGVDRLLEALDELFADPAVSALEFDLAGAGPRAGEVAAFCASHAGRARFHGVVRDRAKSDLLRRAAWVMVPSVWKDNFPRTMLDAFAWGLPVIGGRRGGIPEVVRDDREGQIVEPSAAELAAAMRRYLDDPALRLRHGVSARERATDYTLERQVDLFEAIYRTLPGVGA